MITVYTNFSETEGGKYFDILNILKGIQKPNQKTIDLIDSIRNEEDSKKRSFLKKKLPCILFSGKFSSRKDTAIQEHSGYAVIDLDHVPDVSNLKQKIKLIPYVKSAFVSPSGDGIKVVVRIPKSIQYHRENYLAVSEDFSKAIGLDKKYVDTTSKNESRICFTSYDPDIYIAAHAKCFIPPKKEEVSQVDYNKINIAVNMIRLSIDGEKHTKLYNASRLLGGYIASGMVEESFAVQVLENEIKNKNIDDFSQAQRTIQDGIRDGKSMPLYEMEQMESSATIEEIKVRLQDNTRRYEFLSNLKEDRDMVLRYKNNEFEIGKTTGHKNLDTYFLFKEGVTNVVLGHANVGKSYFMWWLMVLSAILHKWKWIVFSSENKSHQIKKKLVEFYTSKNIQDMHESEIHTAMDWVDEHFNFIRIDKHYSATQLLEYATILCQEDAYKGFLIDPYNSLAIDQKLWKEVGGNRHEYDYTISSYMNNFADQNNVSIFINAHAISEALRRKHPKSRKGEEPHRYEGQPMPPESADIEGGGKFVNRVTGFFMVVHRYLYDVNDWNITKVEIKKVKDTESGGLQTKYEDPVDFKMTEGMNGFYEVNEGTNPVKKFIASKKPRQSEMDLQPNYSQPISRENSDFEFGGDEKEPPF